MAEALHFDCHLSNDCFGVGCNRFLILADRSQYQAAFG
jgi:hypothetical protein